MYIASPWPPWGPPPSRSAARCQVEEHGGGGRNDVWLVDRPIEQKRALERGDERLGEGFWVEIRDELAGGDGIGDLPSDPRDLGGEEGLDLAARYRVEGAPASGGRAAQTHQSTFRRFEEQVGIGFEPATGVLGIKCFDAGAELMPILGGDGGEQVRLAGEVVVDRWRPNTEFLGDRGEAESGGAAGLDGAGCGVDGLGADVASAGTSHGGPSRSAGRGRFAEVGRVPHVRRRRGEWADTQQRLVGLAQAIAPVAGRLIAEVAAGGVAVGVREAAGVFDGHRPPDAQAA